MELLFGLIAASSHLQVGGGGNSRFFLAVSDKLCDAGWALPSFSDWGGECSGLQSIGSPAQVFPVSASPCVFVRLADEWIHSFTHAFTA
mmetsp:Transcript_7768/g.15124  ORF Transcript_7768/g.15124 Transcript_7768/m.15124 type:complete len:89 (+) Transcript_7768:926-1192(+)